VLRPFILWNCENSIGIVFIHKIANMEIRDAPENASRFLHVVRRGRDTMAFSAAPQHRQIPQ
jgi:hypothetical protein